MDISDAFIYWMVSRCQMNNIYNHTNTEDSGCVLQAGVNHELRGQTGSG